MSDTENFYSREIGIGRATIRSGRANALNTGIEDLHIHCSDSRQMLSFTSTGKNKGGFTLTTPKRLFIEGGEDLKPKEDAIQIGETKEVSVEVPSGDSTEVGEPVQKSDETTEGFHPIQEVTEEEVKQVKAEIKEAKRDEQVLGRQLPENVEKLVSFMEDTGGTVEDYVRLNADYSKIDEKALLKEYYKKNKPHLDNEDVDLILEDFTWDEDIHEEKEIRKKKLAFKEEVAKAKTYLDDLKSKYYDEIKLRPGVTQEQQKAMDFFNRYNKQQENIKQSQEDFKNRTKQVLNNEFEGFEYNVGDKKFRYKIKDPVTVAEKQSDINNFVGRFLDNEGKITDTAGYHKALYAAMNADKLASHFYEQGKADGVKSLVQQSKNPANDEPRQVASGDVFVGGFKVKAISGSDSSKLKIKKRTFNN